MVQFQILEISGLNFEATFREWFHQFISSVYFISIFGVYKEFYKIMSLSLFIVLGIFRINFEFVNISFEIKWKCSSFSQTRITKQNWNPIFLKVLFSLSHLRNENCSDQLENKVLNCCTDHFNLKISWIVYISFDKWNSWWLKQRSIFELLDLSIHHSSHLNPEFNF